MTNGTVIVPGETIRLEVRRHWFVFLGRALSFALAALIPFIIGAGLILFFPAAGNALGAGKFSAALVVFGASWLLMLSAAFYMAFADYYLDVFTLTDRRIIDIEQLGLFRRDIATIPIDNIQDIKVEILGMIPTFFNFGNLHLQTAGLSKEVVIRGIPHPQKVKDAIMELYHRAGKESQNP